jgi:hypothetical protein
MWSKRSNTRFETVASAWWVSDGPRLMHRAETEIVAFSTNPVAHIAGVGHASYMTRYRALLLLLHDRIDEVDVKIENGWRWRKKRDVGIGSRLQLWRSEIGGAAQICFDRMRPFLKHRNRQQRRNL